MMKFWGIVLAAAVMLPLSLRGDAQYYRYSDGRQVYYTRDNCIYRYSDGRKVFYFRGEDEKLTVFMLIMLEEGKDSDQQGPVKP